VDTYRRHAQVFLLVIVGQLQNHGEDMLALVFDLKQPDNCHETFASSVTDLWDERT
jgi:hypothetical protein